MLGADLGSSIKLISSMQLINIDNVFIEIEMSNNREKIYLMQSVIRTYKIACICVHICECIVCVCLQYMTVCVSVTVLPVATVLHDFPNFSQCI